MRVRTRSQQLHRSAVLSVSRVLLLSWEHQLRVFNSRSRVTAGWASAQRVCVGPILQRIVTYPAVAAWPSWRGIMVQRPDYPESVQSGAVTVRLCTDLAHCVRLAFDDRARFILLVHTHLPRNVLMKGSIDWFLPALHADVHAEYKCTRRVVVSSEGNAFGRTSNQLMQLVHLTLLGLRPCVEIQVPPSVMKDPLSKAIDLPAFFSSNATRLYSAGNHSGRDHFLNIKPFDLHFANIPGGILTGPTFRDLSAIMTSQILEHPSRATAAAVEATLRGFPRPFAAVHLRTFEQSSCKDSSPVHGKYLCQTAAWATVNDLCSMSARYIKSYLGPSGITRIYVAGDKLTSADQVSC